MGFLDQGEASRTILGRIAPGVQGLADEGAIAAAVITLDLSQGDDFIDNARQFEAGIGKIDMK